MRCMRFAGVRGAMSLVGLALTVCLESLSGLGIAQAQSSQFTATPLFPESTMVAGVKTPPRTRQAATYVAPSTSTVSGFCTITVAPGINPAGGYLPLSGFGILPVVGVGDDTVTNFNTPSYRYAGETWSRVGFSSNGYVIVGGANVQADNSFFNQNLPNSALPNNVLALLWTDLNPSVAGALRIAALTDGIDTWIVLDWNGVPEFSNNTHLYSFEAWIGINTDTHPGEDITYVYGLVGGNGSNGFATVGAENKFGDRGANYYVDGVGTLPVAPTTQLRVTTSGCPGPPPAIPTLDQWAVAMLALLIGGLGAVLAWRQRGTLGA